jgi:predicted transcriptional regulator
MNKHKTSVAMSQEAERLLRLLAEKLSISKSAVLEIAIREKARSEGIR